MFKYNTYNPMIPICRHFARYLRDPVNVRLGLCALTTRFCRVPVREQWVYIEHFDWELFHTAITREICHRVWYIATCPSETVIVIQSAVFSRMQSSRCIDFNTTDLECYGNFQLSVEPRCDGESECLLDV